MKRPSLVERMQNRIEDMKQDACFSRSDFADLGSREAISQVLSRLERKGDLQSPLHGYYCKVRIGKLLGEPLPPNYGALAEAIARNSGWVILPTGDIVLNEFGLSTQVPVVWSYVSTGPYRDYDANGRRIEFKHATARDLFNMSRTSAMVVQALKTIGRAFASDQVIAKLRDRLTEEDRRRLLQETTRTTSWIFEIIRRIAKGDQDESSGKIK